MGERLGINKKEGFTMSKVKLRLRVFKKSLEVIKGIKGAFVIFINPNTEKFIQFVSYLKENPKNNNFICDIPYQKENFNQPSKKEILNIFNGFEEYNMSLQKPCELEEAVKLTELFFIKICNFEKNYSVKVSIKDVLLD